MARLYLDLRTGKKYRKYKEGEDILEQEQEEGRD
jgi:hypothetical protein